MPYFTRAFISSMIAIAGVTPLRVPIFMDDIDLAKDTAQYQACKAANPATTFAGIRYGEGPPETVAYNQCVPWRNGDGDLIANAVFCQPANCFVFS
ncbi:hypothetical protein CPC08DRAFT_821652 [Agrocybe pediades]|nr:hypothetical protein CPC08DRAFT_821652 [Agrocybe pediades]